MSHSHISPKTALGTSKTTLCPSGRSTLTPEIVAVCHWLVAQRLTTYYNLTYHGLRFGTLSIQNISSIYQPSADKYCSISLHLSWPKVVLFASMSRVSNLLIEPLQWTHTHLAQQFWWPSSWNPNLSQLLGISQLLFW